VSRDVNTQLMSSLHLSLKESNETKEWITSALKLAGSEGTLLLPNWRSWPSLIHFSHRFTRGACFLTSTVHPIT